MRTASQVSRREESWCVCALPGSSAPVAILPAMPGWAGRLDGGRPSSPGVHFLAYVPGTNRVDTGDSDWAIHTFGRET